MSDKLAAIRETVRQQDEIIVKIDNGVNELHEQAVKIQDELELQRRMIDDIAKKTDAVGGKMDSIGTRVGTVLREQRKTPLVCYGICLFIAFVIGITIYLMVSRG